MCVCVCAALYTCCWTRIFRFRQMWSYCRKCVQQRKRRSNKTTTNQRIWSVEKQQNDVKPIRRRTGLFKIQNSNCQLCFRCSRLSHCILVINVWFFFGGSYRFVCERWPLSLFHPLPSLARFSISYELPCAMHLISFSFHFLWFIFRFALPYSSLARSFTCKFLDVQTKVNNVSDRV